MSVEDPMDSETDAGRAQAGAANGTSESDAQMWSKAAAGDEAARARLAAVAISASRSELGRRGVQGPEMADLIQEAQRTTFAFLSRNSVPPKDLWTFLKYRAWGVLSDYRKKMRTAQLDYRDDLEPLLNKRPTESSVGEGLRTGEIGAALADCRRRLPPELARVLAMRYDSGLASDAIQQRLGVHRNTIHVRVFRALERMRECMGAKGFGPEDLQ